MRQDPRKYREMPLIKGSPFNLTELPRIPYPDVQVLALQYETDPEAVRALLPDCYQVAEKPVVTIFFGHNYGLAFMAGGGYRLAAVQVAARFDGEQDHVEGDYILVMFENKTRPILGGREHLGVPKQYADISPVKILTNGNLRCEASLWGHLLFGIEVACPSRQSAPDCQEAGKSCSERATFGYKSFQSLDGSLDADYPMVSWADCEVEQMWVGAKARLYLGSPTEEDIGEFKPVLDALRSLPVLEITQALRTRGSMVLRYDKCRRLR